MADLLYIKPKQSVKVNERKVLLKDMAEIYSDNPDIAFAADKIEVYKFKEKGKKQHIISILDVVTTLTSMFADVDIINLGEPDTIIYYEASKCECKGDPQIHRIMFHCLLRSGILHNVL